MRKDHKLHLLYGAAISLATIIILAAIGWEYFLMGFAAATFIGLMKEVLWDKYLGKGQSEWLDWGYTVLGGLLIELLIFLIKFTINIS